MSDDAGYEGRCTCGEVRYRLNSRPMIVHACHCTECQRLSGGAFAVNALVETDHIDLLGDEPVAVPVTGTSGREQTIMRCRKCQVALWSHYPGAGPGVAFVRVGTLNDPGSLPPDIHIFTSTKLPWLAIPPDAQAVDEFYDPAAVWSAENRHRFALARKA